MFQIQLKVSSNEANLLADIYLNLGALSACLQKNNNTTQTLTLLAEKASWFKAVGIHEKLQRLKKSDWEYKHELSVSTLPFISGVVVESAHAPTLTHPKNTLVLKMDLRGAFGDGAHPSSQLCGQLLTENLDLSLHHSLVDIGTGTGILALLATKLGLKTVNAFDFEPTSVKRAKQNAKLNKAKIKLWQGDVLSDTPPQPYDIVIANLHSDLIERSLPQLKQWLAPKGLLILSGISQQWKNHLKNHLTQNKFTVIKEKELNGWIGYLVT